MYSLFIARPGSPTLCLDVGQNGNRATISDIQHLLLEKLQYLNHSIDGVERYDEQEHSWFRNDLNICFNQLYNISYLSFHGKPLTGDAQRESLTLQQLNILPNATLSHLYRLCGGFAYGDPEITVCIDGVDHTMKIPQKYTDLYGTVKHKFSLLTGIPKEQITLMHNGDPVPDTKSPQTFHRRQSDKFVAEIAYPPNADFIRIKINCPDDKSYSMQLSKSATTVFDLKKMLTSRTSFPPSLVVLFYKQTQLTPDGYKLSQFDISDSSELFLYLKSHGMIVIFRLLDGSTEKKKNLC